MASETEGNPYTIVRVAPQKIVSRPMWRTNFEDDSLVILTPPETTTEELADQLYELALQLKEQT